MKDDFDAAEFAERFRFSVGETDELVREFLESVRPGLGASWGGGADSPSLSTRMPDNR